MAIQMEVASPKDRFVAAAIDFVPPFLLFIALAAAGFSGPAMILALLSSVYFVFRDVLGNGQSPGKRFCDLQVIDTETDRVPQSMGLILRNLGFGAPGFNVVYAIVEGIRVLQQPQGLRFGDVFAETGVVKVPQAEREKLLVPKRDRPSRESKAVEVAADVAPPAEGAAPAVDAVPGTPKAESSLPKSRPAGDLPSGGRPVIPGSSGAAASSAPKAPAAIDLPPDEPRAPAAPAAAAPPPPPAPGGVALDSADPLKALIDQATKK